MAIYLLVNQEKTSFITFSFTTFKKGDGHIFPPLADSHHI
jgi:hypothetical protein